MGDRGHIIIEQRGENEPVVLYSHWGASGLPSLLAHALEPKKRWADHEYLARIIFDELSADANEFTGCGIGTSIHGDTWRVINVDPNKEEITFETGHGYREDPRGGQTFSFEKFVANELGVKAGQQE